jgi:hypothetical protein
MNRNWSVRLALLTSLAFATVAPAPAAAQQAQKPNLLVIMADDVGYWNISVYNRGSFSVEQAMEKLRNPSSSN